jgi:glycerol kinase
LGAAYLAGLAVGFWENLEGISKQWQVEKVFEPKMSRSQVGDLRARWNSALQRAKDWELHAPGQPKKKAARQKAVRR